MTPIRLEEVRGLPERVVAGLMTGTSLDGIDVAICRVAAGEPRLLSLIRSDGWPFPAGLRQRLLLAHEAKPAELAALGRTLGEAYAEAVARSAEAAGVRVELVGSHGQTVHHDHGRTTLQIGEPAFLALRLGCPVVSDFRQNDIAAGGCGAPLVPIVDRWLLRRPDRAVLALNIGGISNLTLVPSEGDERAVIGFDCGPGNMLLDELARRFTQGREACDRDGRFAARGRADPALLRELLAEPFLHQPPPRSFGREQYGSHYVDRLLARTGADGSDDLFATVTELTVRAVHESYLRHVAPVLPAGEVVVSGGGARNPEMMRRLGLAFAPVPVVTNDERGLPGDAKEAIAFALLASARVDGVPGNLPEVTGASGPVLLGKVTEC